MSLHIKISKFVFGRKDNTKSWSRTMTSNRYFALKGVFKMLIELDIIAKCAGLQLVFVLDISS